MGWYGQTSDVEARKRGGEVIPKLEAQGGAVNTGSGDCKDSMAEASGSRCSERVEAAVSVRPGIASSRDLAGVRQGASDTASQDADDHLMHQGGEASSGASMHLVPGTAGARPRAQEDECDSTGKAIKRPLCAPAVPPCSKALAKASRRALLAPQRATNTCGSSGASSVTVASLLPLSSCSSPSSVCISMSPRSGAT